jgi:hypothetical protein
MLIWTLEQTHYISLNLFSFLCKVIVPSSCDRSIASLRLSILTDLKPWIASQFALFAPEAILLHLRHDSGCTFFEAEICSGTPQAK